MNHFLLENLYLFCLIDCGIYEIPQNYSLHLPVLFTQHFFSFAILRDLLLATSFSFHALPVHFCSLKHKSFFYLPLSTFLFYSNCSLPYFLIQYFNFPIFLTFYSILICFFELVKDSFEIFLYRISRCQFIILFCF